MSRRRAFLYAAFTTGAHVVFIDGKKAQSETKNNRVGIGVDEDGHIGSSGMHTPGGGGFGSNPKYRRQGAVPHILLKYGGVMLEKVSFNLIQNVS